jgi:antitoxin ParD1/3/4
LPTLSAFDNLSRFNFGIHAMPASYVVGDHFEQFIKRQVEGGRYASASDVVRDALRLLEEEEQRRAAALEALRSEVKKGLDSGEGLPAEQVFDRLERKYAAQSAAHRST